MAETPAANPETPPTLGARLRSVREQRGLALHQVAQDLHVGDEVIAALENDDYAVLGVPIFVRGHLRNYAQLLGLPAGEVIAAYEHAAKRLSTPRLVTTKPEGNPAARRAGLQVFSILVIVVLVALAVVWWQHRVPAAMPGAVVTSAPATATTHPNARPPAGQTSQLAQIPLSVPAAAGTSSAAAGHAAAAAGSRAPAPAAVPPPAVLAPAVSGAYAQVVHARFAVKQASWLEVYDASGRKLYYGMAPAGDNLTLSGAGPLQVFVGNAPGVSVELNGAPFNFSQFTQPNNTARFSLGAAVGSGGQPG